MTKSSTKMANGDVPRLSIVVPTRDRAEYLGYALQTCLLSDRADYEVVVLDNASVDGTADLIGTFDDPRLRYERSDRRLSMRDNFERGLDSARGQIIGFIGDDDGIFDFTPDRVLNLFAAHPIDAIAAARAHYGWPDLLSQRRDTGLLPRSKGVSIQNSRFEVKGLLRHSDYYRLPCIYHGFVRTSVLKNIQQRHGRFFLSSQVDIFSAIALSMEGIEYAYSGSPLVINGGSSRSNGASHFGGGSEIEKSKWVQEDDLGFLPGFVDHATVASLIVESAVRYSQHYRDVSLGDIFPTADVRLTLAKERAKRIALGKPLTDFDQTWVASETTDCTEEVNTNVHSVIERARHLYKAFGAMRPFDMRARGIGDILAASRLFSSELSQQKTSAFPCAIEQVRIATKIASSRGS
jgi:glycosyltransferase involved in cell wall biosynthesis